MAKILFVTTKMVVGGVEKSLIEMANAVDFSKHEVDLLVFHPIPEEGKTLLAELDPRVRVINPKQDTLRYALLAYVERGIFFLYKRNPLACLAEPLKRRWVRMVYLRQYCNAIPYARKHPYHVAIAYQDNYPAVFVSKPCVKAQKKIVFFRNAWLGVDPTIYDKPFAALDTIVAVSGGVGDMLRQAYPAVAQKVLTLPDPIPYEAIVSGAQAYTPALPKDRTVLCSCGRLTDGKGFELAVRAAKLLKDKGLRFCWYFIGDGNDRASIEAEIQQLGLTEDIVLTGTVFNPFPYFKHCDIYVQPSHRESYGRTIREAMVLCKPVVSTRTIGAQCNIEDRKTGILTDISAEGIAAGIYELTQDPALQASFVQALKAVDYEAFNAQMRLRQRQLYDADATAPSAPPANIL